MREMPMTNIGSECTPEAVLGACVICGASEAVRERLASEKFHYGAGSDQVLLSAEVLVAECLVCEEAYTGEHGEIARAEAVAQHLGNP
jgi:hypothetical protein